MTSANTAEGLYGKERFSYQPEKNVYLGPAGRELTYRFSTNEKGRPIHYYRASDCRSCALKKSCTRNQANRTITRLAFEEIQEAMAARVRANPELMRRRKAIIEHCFGTIKRTLGCGSQLTIEHFQKLLVQPAGQQPFAETADRRLIGHRLGRAQPDELLKAQPVAQLLLGLRIAQSVEMLQNHDAQQHWHAMRRPSQHAVGRRQCLLRLAKVDPRIDRFQDSVAPCAPCHCEVKKDALFVRGSLHPSDCQIISIPRHSFRRDFQRR